MVSNNKKSSKSKGKVVTSIMITTWKIFWALLMDRGKTPVKIIKIRHRKILCFQTLPISLKNLKMLMIRIFTYFKNFLGRK